MSRYCRCTRRCRHLIPGEEPVFPPERYLELEPVMGLLVDLADAFDMDSLMWNPECSYHGDTRASNSECLCRGKRLTQSEFVEALQGAVREARARGRSLPAGQPNRKRNGIRRLMIAS